MSTSLARLRCAETFTLVGERRKPLSGDSTAVLSGIIAARWELGDAPYFSNRNFFLFAASIDFDLGPATLLRFSVFSFQFRGGDAHESYLLALRHRLADQLDLCLDAGLDAGGDDERVFDSLVSLSFVYRFPSRRPEGMVHNE